MALDTSALRNSLLLNSEANTPEKQSDRCETVPDKVPLEASLECLIDNNLVQMDNLRRLPDALLHSYLAGTRELVLLTRDKHVHQATLSSFTETYIVTAMKHTGDAIKLGQKPDQPIIAVFSEDGNRKYILHGKLSKVDAHGLQLTYRAPRHDSRFLVNLAEPGIVYALSSPKSLELIAEALQPAREITSITSGKGYKQITRIEDMLCEREGDVHYRPPDYVDADTAKQAVVHDLSLGGAQLILDEPFPDSADKRFLEVKLDLPPVETSPQITTLNILSVLRASRCVDSKVHLHCRFLHRLPDDLESLLDRLPQQENGTSEAE